MELTIWKTIWAHRAYAIPGVGLYKELKKPREERKIKGVVGTALYAIPLALKIALLPSYIVVGIKTGEWNIIEKTKTEIYNLFHKEEKGLVGKINDTYQFPVDSAQFFKE